MHDNSPNLAVRFLTAKAKRNIHYIAVLLASVGLEPALRFTLLLEEQSSSLVSVEQRGLFLHLSLAIHVLRSPLISPMPQIGRAHV